ncbi:porin family protein, partial [bacterium]|nr:porin family protein [bacterium]
IYRAKFTPKDEYQNFIKPGHDQNIRFNVERAVLSQAPIDDDLQGSYFKKILVPTNSLRPMVQMQYDDFLFEPRIITDDLKGDNWRIKPNAFSLHVGAAIPRGASASLYSPNLNIAVDFTKQLNRSWILNAMLGYSRFEGKASTKDLAYWNFSANIRWVPFVAPSYRIYINGGSGYYFPNHGASHAGYNAGAGFNFPISPSLDFEIGSDYHNVFLNNDDFAFIRVHGGVLLRF